MARYLFFLPVPPLLFGFITAAFIKGALANKRVEST